MIKQSLSLQLHINHAPRLPYRHVVLASQRFVYIPQRRKCQYGVADLLQCLLETSIDRLAGAGASELDGHLTCSLLM